MSAAVVAAAYVVMNGRRRGGGPIMTLIKSGTSPEGVQVKLYDAYTAGYCIELNNDVNTWQWYYTKWSAEWAFDDMIDPYISPARLNSHAVVMILLCAIILALLIVA